MVRSREQAVVVALQRKSNVPGTCQLVTRGYYLAPSAGDQNGDGDADAVDGWVSEPVAARHPGDRNPPVGVPVAWSGGSRGFGHRAITVPFQGGVGIHSTDVPKAGATSTVPLSWFEKNWPSLHYLGWSETITGEFIPFTAGPAVPPRFTKVSRARKLIEKALIRAEAKGQTQRARALRRALRALPEA